MSDNEKTPVSDRGTLVSGFTPDAEFHTIPPSKEFADVRAFHQKFGLMCFDTPGHLTLGKLKERIEFMQEELDEFKEAAGFMFNLHTEQHEIIGGQDLAKQADALVDLVYVALGTAVMMGLPWDWLWNDVHRANMMKVRGVTHRGHAVDVKKPPGWQGPQGERILLLAGYKGEEFKTRIPMGIAGDSVAVIDEEKCRDDTQR